MMEIQVKSIIKYHYTPNKMLKIKNTDNTMCWQGHGKKMDLSYTVGGSVNWNNHFGKLAISTKVKNVCSQ